MLILGTIQSFTNLNRFETPIKQIPNGFEFGNMKFTNPDDAIFYFSDTTATASRFVITGNSDAAIWPVANNPQTLYQYSIYENGIVTHFGNCTDNKFDKSKHAYLPELKEKYYQLYKTKYYDFYISKRFDNQISLYKNRMDSLDLFVDTFMNVMELKMPTFKIQCYIHNNQEEISIISSYFNDLCNGGTTYGRVNGKEIHSLRFGGSIEHETSHLIFDSQSNVHFSTFFSEGIRQYYDYITNPTHLSDGITTAHEFIDEDIKPVILGYDDFFQGNKYYQISGVFVKYLVDTWGLDKIKQFYRTDNIENGLEQIYSIKLDTFLVNYKEWLKKK